jgi:hypothetical protein
MAGSGIAADWARAFSLDASTDKLSEIPTAQGTFQFIFPGGQPVVSASDATHGIVWVVDHSPSDTLPAYDASNVAAELYRSPGLGRERSGQFRRL